MLWWKSGGNQPVILRSPTCRPSLPICESSLSPSPAPSPSSSSSSSSSPGGRRQDGRGALSGRDDDLPRRPPQLTRQRKLRHLSDFYVEGLGRGLDGGATNGCGGSGGWCVAAAPTSSALIPQPLPLPAADSAHKGSASSGHEFLNLPSFRGERVEAILSAEPSPSIMETAGERLPSAASFKRLAIGGFASLT
ncbi:unnamed protein product [Spirodela intermedia]|uniref:Uncharacterized protein n=1 Tax=Spirodela intermedia TaxID=51605 RepID=A0A7I8L519_SPIIN|nr:unnamed protein product [Spirodela intermedia]